jgi:DNA mismatch endonuclease (patch repair protein)
VSGIKGYRLNVRALPGRPDLAFGRWRVAVFVDGEFWHGHPSAFLFGTKGEYWDAKIARNQARDTVSNSALTEAGWTVIRLWARNVERDPGAASELVSHALAAAGRGR